MKLLNMFGPLFQKWSQVSSVLVSGGEGVIWPSKRYDVYAQEAYLTNVIAYRCIDEVAKAMESVIWRLERRSKDGTFEEITDHPIIDLMYRPNPEEHWGQLIYKHTAFTMISGNSYMERISVDGGRRPKELWVHRPDRMKILVSKSGLRTGYEYTGPEGRKVTWDVDVITGKSDLWHSKMFSPLNDWYGDGPVEPTARQIDTHNAAIEWNKSLLMNSGKIGMIFSFDNNIGDTEYNRLDKRLRQERTGPKSVGKHIILEGPGAKVTPYGFSPQEMDFIEGNRELARNICLGFGMPPMVIGIPGDNTYSNYKEALLAFWENTVFSVMWRFAHGFSHWMFDQTERIMLTPDMDSIPALEPRRAEAWAKTEKADFLTINEKRDLTGYEKYSHTQDEAEDDDPADIIYQDGRMIPLSSEMNEMKELAAQLQNDIAAREASGQNDKPKPGEEKPKPKPKK